MSHSQEGSSINNKEISHLKNEYIKFTEFLCSVIGEDKFKKSKFWFFQKQLSKLHELDLTDQKNCYPLLISMEGYFQFSKVI